MEQNNQSRQINAENVEKQLDQLEENTATNEQNKKGSTNEIQTFATEDGVTQ